MNNRTNQWLIMDAGGIAGIIKDKVTSDRTHSKTGNAIVGTSEDVLASYVVE